jgi:ubiquinone/menaquinone biosynthesis C-methylase UbiE
MTITQNPSPYNRDQAQIYDTFLVPAIFAAATDVLLSYAGPKAGERVLDVACGTGVVARHAAAQVGNRGSVTGLDNNREMLDVARQIPPPTGAPIFWRQADAHALPFEDGSFELVLCQHGLQYFNDPGHAIAEMRRVLTPSGRLAVNVFSSLSDNPFFQTFDQHVIRHLGASLLEQWFSFGSEQHLESLMSAAGCNGVTTGQRIHNVAFPDAHTFVQIMLLGTPAVLEVSKFGQGELAGVVDALVSDMADTFDRHTRYGSIIFPVQTIVGRARPESPCF